MQLAPKERFHRAPLLAGGVKDAAILIRRCCQHSGLLTRSPPEHNSSSAGEKPSKHKHCTTSAASATGQMAQQGENGKMKDKKMKIYKMLGLIERIPGIGFLTHLQTFGEKKLLFCYRCLFFGGYFNIVKLVSYLFVLYVVFFVLCSLDLYTPFNNP